jgi:4-hydroxy-L-threonine phosphate dehydrogenase PdxA
VFCRHMRNRRSIGTKGQKNMNDAKTPVLGIILGDHAGIGPEITAMALRGIADYAAVLVGCRRIYDSVLRLAPGAEKQRIADITASLETPKKAGQIYFCDIPAGQDIAFGKVTPDSGRLIFDSISKMIELGKNGIVDGFVMGPITKQALHAAGLMYSSEFEIFSDLYNAKGVRAVVKAGDIFRSTVVGHIRFTDIVRKLTTEGIVQTGRSLVSVMRRFHPDDPCKIAVAAINPHAGEDGLFGDEEQRIIMPAVEQLRLEGFDVIGPCPADTVYYRAQTGKIQGIVYMYHDQGNIAMKAASFGDGVLVYVNVPEIIVSVGHGGAFGSAGKGTANPNNMIAAIGTLLDIIKSVK